MVSSLLLPPGAGVLEVFPYALGPDSQGLVKHLCQIRGIGYEAWVNKDPSKTITYPNRAPKEGGIAHLDQEVQVEPFHVIHTNLILNEKSCRSRSRA